MFTSTHSTKRLWPMSFSDRLYNALYNLTVTFIAIRSQPIMGQMKPLTTELLRLPESKMLFLSCEIKPGVSLKDIVWTRFFYCYNFPSIRYGIRSKIYLVI